MAPAIAGLFGIAVIGLALHLSWAERHPRPPVALTAELAISPGETIESSGLEAGFRIRAVGGRAVNDLEDLYREMEASDDGVADLRVTGPIDGRIEERRVLWVPVSSQPRLEHETLRIEASSLPT